MDEDDYDYEPDYDYDEVEEEEGVGMDSFMPMMEAAVRFGGGINFTLMMQHDVLNHSDNGPNLSKTISVDYSIHPRYHQPCYGELRKYRATHPDECTQPWNSKPTDLWDPFPAGRPIMVGTNFSGQQSGQYHYDCDVMITEAFGPESPWVLGSKQGLPTFVEGEKYLVGVILKDTKIDPTVMVNLFNNLKCRTGLGLVYKQLRDEGLSVRETFAVLLHSGRGSPLAYINGPDGYYTSYRVSARRILEAKPRDLSGGFFCDRIDYNRTELENVFALDDKPVMTLADALQKLGLGEISYGSNLSWNAGVSEKDRIKGLRDAILMVAETEPDQKETKFDISTSKCVVIEPQMKEAA